MPLDNVCACPNTITRQCVASNNNECGDCGKFLIITDTSVTSENVSEESIDVPGYEPTTEQDVGLITHSPERGFQNGLTEATLGLKDLRIKNEDCTAGSLYSNICVCGFPPGSDAGGKPDTYCNNCGRLVVLLDRRDLPQDEGNHPVENRRLSEEVRHDFSVGDYSSCPLQFGEELGRYPQEVHTFGDYQGRLGQLGLDCFEPPPTYNTERLINEYSDVLLGSGINNDAPDKIRQQCPADLEVFLNPTYNKTPRLRRFSFSDIKDVQQFPSLRRHVTTDLTRLEFSSTSGESSICARISRTASEEHIYSDILNIRPIQRYRMEHFTRTMGLRPPRFEARKSDVKKFFSRYDKFIANNPHWDDPTKVTYLGSLLDDESLDFFDDLEDGVQRDYDRTKQEFIDHYASTNPPPTQWSIMTKRKQLPLENITEYYDALLRLGQGIEIPPQQLLFVLLDGLPDDTKNHIALGTEEPIDVRDAYRLAKKYQTITHYTDPAKKLLKTIKDGGGKPTTSVVRHRDDSNSDQIESMKESIEKLSKQMDKLCNQKPQDKGDVSDDRGDNKNEDRFQQNVQNRSSQSGEQNQGNESGDVRQDTSRDFGNNQRYPFRGSQFRGGFQNTRPFNRYNNNQGGNYQFRPTYQRPQFFPADNFRRSPSYNSNNFNSRFQFRPQGFRGGFPNSSRFPSNNWVSRPPWRGNGNYRPSSYGSRPNNNCNSTIPTVWDNVQLRPGLKLGRLRTIRNKRYVKVRLLSFKI